MAFFGGDGSEVRAPMARAIIGGLFTSSLLTLVVMPTLYIMFERSGIKRRDKKQKIEQILEKEGLQ
jgi:Cu/Ag efflux pump CusA